MLTARCDTAVVIRDEARARATALEGLKAFRYLVDQLDRHLRNPREVDVDWVRDLTTDLSATALAYRQALDEPLI